MTETKTALEAAIERSISHNEIVHVEIAASDIGEVIAAIDGYEIDHARENDGSFDVWGWTAETPEGEQDWRIKVTLTGPASQPPKQTAPQAGGEKMSNWYLISPDGSSWVAVKIGKSGDMVGMIEECEADTHVAANDRRAWVVEAVRDGATSDDVDDESAVKVVAAWDADADASQCVVERILEATK